ncbi:nucleotide pyrophosphohydrolase [Nitrogeniibacter mangrovi]|uniref:Nucleotide pyrophosphohydrolase n=1 Tax=Nitrogeniibacter mangrovi TaxID=2016596 RepID=A0A6C1B2U8_9RHOO|nr:nucleotide pyrophosphohydrolase [Nitrogeniibacter mangrovi]QID17887.1 nucleotide pyrophosphohydrolase [Nitrogeniibacter mangrovi]
MTVSQDTLELLRDRLRDFAEARDWTQFHTPKNLAMALVGEAAEVVEHFQWLTPEASAELDDADRQAVSHELADVLLYLVRLADRLDIDLRAAALEKLAINAERYPVDRAYGRADKYTRLGTDDDD